MVPKLLQLVGIVKYNCDVSLKYLAYFQRLMSVFISCQYDFEAKLTECRIIETPMDLHVFECVYMRCTEREKR